MRYLWITTWLLAATAASFAQGVSVPSAEERRSSVMRTYFSAFGSQGQSSLERLNALSLTPEVFQSIPLEEAINPDEYVLGAGDVIEVNLFGTIPLTLRSMIAPDGMLSLRTVGVFNAKGKTLTEIKKAIEQGVLKQYRASSVSVSLHQPRTFLVLITGAVTLRSQQPATPLDRVDKIFYLANSQGQPQPDASQLLARRLYPDTQPPIKASLRNIVLRHSDGTTEPVDLIRYFLTGERRFNPRLREGDVIEVPNLQLENMDLVGIDGAVHLPALYEYSQFDSLTTLYKIALGATKYADLERVQITRHTEKGFERLTVNLAAILAGKAPDVPLLPNDRVQVPLKTHARIGNVTVRGAVAYPGFYAIESQKTTLKEVIALAGGFTSEALLSAARIFRRQKSEEGVPLPANVPPDLDFIRQQLIRTGDLDAEELANFNLELGARRNYVAADFRAIFSGKSSDVVLEDGDLIIVPRDAGTVYVFGQVANPGYVKYDAHRSYKDYIALAGGETSESTGDVRILKAGSFEWKYPNETVVESGDWIFVPKKFQKTFAQQMAEITPVVSIISTVATLALLIFQVFRQP
ncbi:MAG: SLBB domain-containing protein [Chloroherpetonaceae bacterium]|nr:SLBB domain-containing protein [Chloroherpetonaceae bacterium]MCS7210858.1 SLBB domain-containing protein [Chloroherpetonaceae bacterium]MDW8018455.1 SLBB domain-containing protein [Chloroherpetonaceae bacterium]